MLMHRTDANDDAAGMRRERLANWRRHVEQIILARQHPLTGLLPASTAVTVHGDYRHAWVRDNVYSMQAAWALALACRRHDPGGAAPLEDAVVRLMRGLLAAMMKQAHKVERFKHTLDPLDALHAKVDAATGDPVVGDADWGHLQIDATAIYLLALAQISASGLRIVEHPDEAAMVQNLVHYLACAWRTPDFGIWERGDKRNEGRAELNASSIGMARAALEAIDGFDPLPGIAPPVLAPADDAASAAIALEALLPRESESKETDAALLSIVGWPAYAADAALARRTRAEVLAKLLGRHGCKRFLLDGHQTVLEDAARLHYEPGELSRFEHIESEWPLFFTYLLIDAALDGRRDEAAYWRGALERLMRTQDGQALLPELYYVPAEHVDAERAAPGSQPRLPGANLPLVWAQSLYVVGALLHEGWIDASDLDPLQRRHAPLRARAVTVQLALVADDEVVASRLAAHGLAAQSAAALQPIELVDRSAIEVALSGLGRCDGLGLSGRPQRPLGGLSSSRLFECETGQFVCTPAFSGRRGFHLGLDNRLLVDQIRAEVTALQRHWRGPGQPLLVLAVDAPMLDAPDGAALIAALGELGATPGVTIETLQQMLGRVGRCRLPERPAVAAAGVAARQDRSAVVPLQPADEAATRPLTPARAAAIAAELDSARLLQQLQRSRNPYEQAELITVLWRRHGACHSIAAGADLHDAARALHAQACRTRRWGVIRRVAGLLEIHDEMLEGAVAEIVVRGRRVALGRAYSADAVVARPLAQNELIAKLQAHAGDDPRARVLIEELVLLIAMLIKADQDALAGTLTLRPWQMLLLLSGWLAREHGVTQAEAFDHMLDLSPHAIAGRLREVIDRERQMAANLVSLQALHGSPGRLVGVVFEDDRHEPEPGVGGWPGWREMRGALTRTADDFHARVWQLLQHCAGLVIGDQLDAGNRIDSALARADATPGERGFALRIDELLNRIQAPEYRQLTIEALLALSEITRVNPSLRIAEPLVVDVLLGTAVRIGWLEDHPQAEASWDAQVASAWQAFYACAPHRVANLVMAALAHLLDAAAPPAAEADQPAASSHKEQ